MRSCLGSSPRMRGSPVARVAARHEAGIIPAHAGLTSTCLRPMRRRQDHPRACGAHAAPSPASTRETGSSPRMRGSRRVYGVGAILEGIIPAHAGLTTGQKHKKKKEGDHPRACGAHVILSQSKMSSSGSSPRMRGSLDTGAVKSYSDGIIPAHAGLTHRRDFSFRWKWDHPRACGAHTLAATLRSAGTGSSPRMRGSRSVAKRTPSPAGIIPAHAGLTEEDAAGWASRWDHPRACGAHCDADAQ